MKFFTQTFRRFLKITIHATLIGADLYVLCTPSFEETLRRILFAFRTKLKNKHMFSQVYLSQQTPLPNFGELEFCGIQLPVSLTLGGGLNR